MSRTGRLVLQGENLTGRKSLAFTSLGHFVNDGNVMFVPAIAAIAASDMGVKPPVVLAMFVAFYGASSLLSVFVGRWGDKRGSVGPLIALGLGLLSSGFVGFFVSMVFARGITLAISLVVSSLVAGFGSAFYHPLAAAVLQTAFESKSEGKALGVNGAAGAVGSAIFPSLFFFAAITLTKPGSVFLLAIIGFVASTAISLGLKDRRAGHSESGQTTAPRAKEAMTKGIIILTMVTAVRSASSTGVTSYLAIYIATQKGTGTSTLLGLTFTLIYAAGVVGQLAFGAIVDRYDKRLVLGIASGGSALTTLGYVQTGGNLALVFIALFGFFTFSIFATIFGLTSEYAPEGSKSLGNAMVWGLGTTGGSVLGPAIVGTIIGNQYSLLTYAFEVMVVIGLLGAFVTPMMPKPRKKETLALRM